jgi:hypothetical protein
MIVAETESLDNLYDCCLSHMEVSYEEARGRGDATALDDNAPSGRRAVRASDRSGGGRRGRRDPRTWWSRSPPIGSARRRCSAHESYVSRTVGVAAQGGGAGKFGVVVVTRRIRSERYDLIPTVGSRAGLPQARAVPRRDPQLLPIPRRGQDTSSTSHVKSGAMRVSCESSSAMDARVTNARRCARNRLSSAASFGCPAHAARVSRHRHSLE